MSERKATDVLIELESKIDLALRQIAVIDFNLKMLLNRTAQTSQPVQNIEKSEKKQIEPYSKIEKPVKMESNVLTVESFTQVGNSSQIIKSTTDVSTKKRLVHQNLIYVLDNKNVVLAQVRAYNTNGDLVGETKTNMHGKWSLSLRPGEYVIHITKTGTKTPPRPPINIKNSIIVKDIDNNELEKIQIQ